MRIITIDGGTTNTRITLAENKTAKDIIKLAIGARANMENPELFKGELKSAISNILERNNLKEDDVQKILASGMITSEFGLLNLSHIVAPAGLKELHDGMVEIVLSEISNIPFVFIRGVKTSAKSFESTDMMRGEETELAGILNPDYENCVYVLPGSHSKIIKTDEEGRIKEFSTMLTGEMIASLSQNTILKDAVDLANSETDNEYLLKGYEYCENSGINKALFKTRILKNIYDCNKNQTYSFFIGAVLFGEISEIIKDNCKTVVLGGKSQIKNAMAEILKCKSGKRIISLSETEVANSTVIGAIRIYENKF